MSGGQLVVLDRLGRDVKRYPLPEGLATIGSDPACDIRVMLSSVSPHHATVVVHANQTVVRNVSTSETLVNGQPVSVAALRHKDRIELGGRVLRWEYSDATVERPLAPEPVVYSGGGIRGGRPGRARGRRATAAAPAPPRSPALRLRLEMTHRASMPGGVGSKQVAIVQPQRRDTAEHNEQSPMASKRPRSTKSDGEPSPPAGLGDSDKSKRKTLAARSPLTLQGQETTKATLWIESRKTTPRRATLAAAPRAAPSSAPHAARRRTGAATPASAVHSARRRTGAATPLRLAVLKRRRATGDKIQAPKDIDPTKQAAIMLMTGRSPRPPAVLARRTGSLRLTARASPAAGDWRRTHAVTLLEINDSRQSSSSASFRRSPPVLASPKKSALKDPSVKKTGRKTDSIKFDLSNLDNYDQSQDVFVLSDATRATSYDATVSSEDENVTLHYDTSSLSPSPRRSIHSRSSKVVESTLGTSASGRSSNSLQQSTLTPGTPQSRKSSRGSIIVQKILESPAESSKRYSTRTTKSASDQTYDTTVESAFRTRTLSPRSPTQSNMESYSIVDLVSVDSNESQSSSIYGSVRSRNSSNVAFGTPQNSVGRKTRSIIDRSAVTSSTPYVGKTITRSKRASSSPNVSRNSANEKSQTSRNTRRSKSLTTPENSQQISLNTTRVSRGPRSRSRINDSELMLISSVTEVEDSSPKSSKRLSRLDKSTTSSPLQNTRTSARKTRLTVNVSPNESSTYIEGMSTPENTTSPREAGTPVLNIQSLLDSSRGFTAQKGRAAKRNTFGGIQKKPKRHSSKSKSMNFTTRRSTRRRSEGSTAASDETEVGAPAPDNEDIVTPKSAVKLVPEHVKNKHSTAKKPQSKRSIIDDLNNSDIVKQLFNSPVKRKLSQSMSEYSRRQLLDEKDAAAARRPARRTLAGLGRSFPASPRSPAASLRSPAASPRSSLSSLRSPLASPRSPLASRRSPLASPRSPPDASHAISLGAFVSPLGSPGSSAASPARAGAGDSSRSPRPRRSIRNDLTRVSGVKKIFAKSPRNSLSDVRIKELFAPSQRDDLSRVSGVKTLFRSKTPRNDLRDVRGVKKLFSDGPADDLRNVSGVKRILRRSTPRNDLTDVRGVRKMFGHGRDRTDAAADVSGVEELFDESNRSHAECNHSRNDAEALFDRLLGKPPIRAVYSKTFIKKPPQKPKRRRGKSLQVPLEEIAFNVEEWLERELKKRLQKNGEDADGAEKSLRNVSRELKKLATDTVEGETPLRGSRVRSSTMVSGADVTAGRSVREAYSARRLPLKKRSWAERLPLKKRSVLHSTPVKGRRALPDDELGRVSPIAALDCTAPHHLQLTSTQQTKDLHETGPARNASKTESKIETSKTEKSPKVSQVAATSVAGRSMRTRKTTNAQSSNVKKRRASIVVTKKAPVLSPQPTNKTTTRRKVSNAKKIEKVEVEAPIESPTVTPKKKTTRRQKVDSSTNKKVETSIKTPKRTTRAKVQRASVVVSKPSPKMKPAAPKENADVQPKQTRRTRKTTAPSETIDNVKGKQKTESPKESPKKPATRTRKTAEVIAKPKGRQTQATQPKVIASPRSTRAKTKPEKKTVGSNVEEKSSAKTRGRKLEISVEVAQNKKTEASAAPTRGKKAEPKQVKDEVIKPKNTRNRTNSKQSKEIIELPKTRGRKTEATTAETMNDGKVASTRRGKKVNEEIVQETKKTRGKKVETQDTQRRRGQKTKADESNVVSEVAPTRGRKTKANEEVLQESKRTRGKRNETNITQADRTRGQQAKTNVEDKSRKRKSTMESDVPTKLRKTRSEDVGEAKGRRKAEVVKEAKGREVTKNKTKTRATRPRADAATGTQAKSSSESQPAGRKRKTVADTSDKASKGSSRKQPATKKSKTAVESPQQGTRGRTRAAAEGAKRATRARR